MGHNRDISRTPPHHFLQVMIQLLVDTSHIHFESGHALKPLQPLQILP